MSDIKIFCSHRIDHDAEPIKNPLYIPVRCGSVFDTRSNQTMLGDDTGDNISFRRETFCEWTVLYWAWKNEKADYYGLSHYRRFLSCAKERTDTVSFYDGINNNIGCFSVPFLDKDVYSEYKIDAENLRAEIEGYDAVFMRPVDLKRFGGSNYNTMILTSEWHEKKDVDTGIMILKEKYPEMAETADEYMHKYGYSYLYNCFVMRKEIFEKFCSWIFDILFALEKKVDVSHYSTTKKRAVGLVGEHFVGIWVLWLKKHGYKLNELPVLYVENIKKKHDILPAFKENNIAIAMSSSNEYVPYLSVCLSSLLSSAHSENNYDIIVFERSITAENKEKLLFQIKEYKNVSLRFVNPVFYLKQYDLHFPAHYNLECFFRLTAPVILNAYKKIIFTDIDLIFEEDIKKLYQTDITGYPLAAARDLMWGMFVNTPEYDWNEYAKDKLHLEKVYDYFNTGVMVLNIEEFNKNGYSEKVLQLAEKEDYRILEQDALNVFFGNRIKYIDTAWNHPTFNPLYKKMAKHMPADFEKQYEKDRSNPFIIHWAGVYKVWNYPDIDLGHIWWKYAKKTPFYEEILSNMIIFNQSKEYEKNAKLDYVLNHSLYFELKKIYYRLKKIFYKSGKKHLKYLEKYRAVKSLLKEAKAHKKHLQKI